MLTFPTIYSPRLTLRRLQVEDVSSLVKYANNKKISDHILNMPHPYGEPDGVFRISYVLQGFKNKERYVFAIILNDPEEFIGEVSLHMDMRNAAAQLGYWIAEPFWGKGIATEAVNAVVAFGFCKLDINMIYATCLADNLGSEKVLLKTGMTKSGESGHVMEYRLKKHVQA